MKTFLAVAICVGIGAGVAAYGAWARSAWAGTSMPARTKSKVRTLTVLCMMPPGNLFHKLGYCFIPYYRTGSDGDRGTPQHRSRRSPGPRVVSKISAEGRRTRPGCAASFD